MTVSALTFPLLAMLLWGLAPILGKLGLVRLDPYTALTIRTVVIAFSDDCRFSCSDLAGSHSNCR